MNTNPAITQNHDALKRIVASLVAMAGLATSNMTIRRSLRLAVLRILRPAESATRRLIIAAARGLTVTLPNVREPKPASAKAAPAPTPQRKPPNPDAPPRAPQFCLFDKLRRSRRKKIANRAEPRIRVLDFGQPFYALGDQIVTVGLIPVPRKPPVPTKPKPPAPTPHDLLDATRLARRITALTAALNDLPAQALRFARWQARGDRLLNWLATPPTERIGPQPTRPRRMIALHWGKPPGGRLKRYAPHKRPGKNIREIDLILAHCHHMAEGGDDAFYDTS